MPQTVLQCCSSIRIIYFKNLPLYTCIYTVCLLHKVCHIKSHFPLFFLWGSSFDFLFLIHRTKTNCRVLQGCHIFVGQPGSCMAGPISIVFSAGEGSGWLYTSSFCWRGKTLWLVCISLHQSQLCWVTLHHCKIKVTSISLFMFVP